MPNDKLQAALAQLDGGGLPANSPGLLNNDGAGNLTWTETPNVTSIQFGSGTVLSFYQEATFTPTDASGASLTFTSVSGIQRTVGKLCAATSQVTFPATADTHAIAIGGFPTKAAGNPVPVGSALSTAAVGLATLMQFSGSPNVVSPTAGLGTAIQNSQLTGATLDLSYGYCR